MARHCIDNVCVSLHRTLDLSNNQLSGDIPATLGSLTKLMCVAALCKCVATWGGGESKAVILAWELWCVTCVRVRNESIKVCFTL